MEFMRELPDDCDYDANGDAAWDSSLEGGRLLDSQDYETMEIGLQSASEDQEAASERDLTPEIPATGELVEAEDAPSSPRMVTRKKDISHLTAALREASGRGRGSRKGESDEGVLPSRKSKKRPPLSNRGKKGNNKKTEEQDFSGDWLLHPGGRSAAAALAEAGEEEYVRMTVAPRDFEVEDAPGKPIVLSRVHKGNSMELSEDRLSVTSWKGYRTVMATRGVQDGAWYFEITVEHLGETGHTRLGWATIRAEIQAPVGYGTHSYAYRNLEGCKVFDSFREPYAQPYKEGDVIGCYINLPRGDTLAPRTRPVAFWKRQAFYVEENIEEPPEVPGSEIAFFVNGICQGWAFRGLKAERYFPAASLYTLPQQKEGARVRFNFGPEFKFPPQSWGDWRVPGKPMQEAEAVDPSEYEFDSSRFMNELSKRQKMESAQSANIVEQGNVTVGEDGVEDTFGQAGQAMPPERVGSEAKNLEAELSPGTPLLGGGQVQGADPGKREEGAVEESTEDTQSQAGACAMPDSKSCAAPESECKTVNGTGLLTEKLQHDSDEDSYEKPFTTTVMRRERWRVD